jgi:hypothetical protein
LGGPGMAVSSSSSTTTTRPAKRQRVENVNETKALETFLTSFAGGDANALTSHVDKLVETESGKSLVDRLVGKKLTSP